ncbi:hypothetical protein B0H14DRAFT_3881862 [Mycena olivaceomarginata]|nr:hypothetical protein B0H14DRAFT_3881862 [Mycena olivaceomarginata]
MFESTPVYPSPAPYWMMVRLLEKFYAMRKSSHPVSSTEGFLKLAGYTALSTRLDEMLEVEWMEEQHNDQVLRELDQLGALPDCTQWHVDVSTPFAPAPEAADSPGLASPDARTGTRRTTRSTSPPFLAESSQDEKVLPNWKAEVSVSQVPQDFPGSAIHMVNDNAEVFRGTRATPMSPSITASTSSSRTEQCSSLGVRSDHQPSHTHKNYGATMDASTEDPGFHDLGWIACSLTIANPSVVTLHTASLAPSRPSSRIHCVHGGVGGAYTVKCGSSSWTACAIVSNVALSVTIKLPAHAFSAHNDGVDGATTCGPRVGVDVLDVEARVLSVEGLEHAWGSVGTPSLS